MDNVFAVLRILVSFLIVRTTDRRRGRCRSVRDHPGQPALRFDLGDSTLA
jgi:hypothetical protein